MIDSTIIPDWILLGEIKPVKFYRYKSSTTDRFIHISTWRKEDKTKYKKQIKWFENFKKKLLTKSVIWPAVSAKERGYGVNSKKEIMPIRWDNKVVIECELKGHKNIFIGCFDDNWSIGYGRCGDNWVDGLKIIDKKNGV